MTTLENVEKLERLLRAAYPNLSVSLVASLAMRGEIKRLTKERDEAYEALEEIKTWSEAYPLNIFPEPDFKKAHEVLKLNGMTLDAISASNMRHVLNGMIHIVQRALKAKENK